MTSQPTKTGPSALDSDMPFIRTKFTQPIDPTAKALNDRLFAHGWVDVAGIYNSGSHPGYVYGVPPRVLLPEAVQSSVPSRTHPNGAVPIRYIRPASGKSAGVLLRIHGGGWASCDEKDNDPLMKKFADRTGLTVVSVGYRLAPQNPHPAAFEDCADVAEWLVDHAVEELGGELKFIEGDSAGAHLTLLTHFHLFKSRPKFSIQGLILSYGVYNLGPPMPSMREWELGLVFSKVSEGFLTFIDNFVPDLSPEQRCHPSVSPLYAHLDKENTPPALFICGTLDPLVEENIMMAGRWEAAGGGEAILRLFTGAPHGFSLLPEEVLPSAKESFRAVSAFVEKYLV